MRLILILLGVVTISHSQFIAEQEKKWKDFKLEHAKSFSSPNKENERMETFLQNAAEIEAHNDAFLNGETTHTKGLNIHTDLSEEAFMDRFTGTKMPPSFRSVSVSENITLRVNLPPSLDLRSHAGIGPIRDQDPCGSCWAFATVSSIEYAAWRKTGKIYDLSEQNLIDCVYENGHNEGWMPTAMDWISDRGISSEYMYPYVGIAGACSIKPKSVFLKNPKSYIKIDDNDDAIKSALNQFGVLAVCVDATGWKDYKNGIFSSENAGNPSCNHAVNLVGYGTENDIPYWIIKNSWNTWWGIQGYMYADARRGSNGKNLGGIMTNTIFFPQINLLLK